VRAPQKINQGGDSKANIALLAIACCGQKDMTHVSICGGPKEHMKFQESNLSQVYIMDFEYLKEIVLKSLHVQTPLLIDIESQELPWMHRIFSRHAFGGS